MNTKVELCRKLKEISFDEKLEHKANNIAKLYSAV